MITTSWWFWAAVFVALSLVLPAFGYWEEQREASRRRHPAYGRVSSVRTVERLRPFDWRTDCASDYVSSTEGNQERGESGITAN